MSPGAVSYCWNVPKWYVGIGKPAVAVSVLYLLTFDTRSAVADLRGASRDERPLSGSEFFHFHAVFRKILIK